MVRTEVAVGVSSSDFSRGGGAVCFRERGLETSSMVPEDTFLLELPSSSLFQSRMILRHRSRSGTSSGFLPLCRGVGDRGLGSSRARLTLPLPTARLVTGSKRL
jgi:hypothetical protein